jgi:hypothetical protein
MYINYELLFKKNLTLLDLDLLIKVNQKEGVLLEGVDFSKYEELGLVTFLKAPKEPHLSVRLTKNGKAFLDALCTKDLTQDIGDLTKELIALYEYDGKETGNALEVQKRLVWFIQETGFGPQAIKTVVENYISSSGEYTMRLDNLIWKGQSLAFSIHFHLKESRLFELFTKTYNLPTHFFISPTRSSEDQWLWDLSQLKIPKKANSDFYFTGSAKGDQEFQDKIKKVLKEKINNP